MLLRTFNSTQEAVAALQEDGASFLGGGTSVVRALNQADPSMKALVRVLDPGAVKQPVEVKSVHMLGRRRLAGEEEMLLEQGSNVVASRIVGRDAYVREPLTQGRPGQRLRRLTGRSTARTHADAGGGGSGRSRSPASTAPRCR